MQLVFLRQVTRMGKDAGVSLVTLPGEEQSSGSEDGCSWHESAIWLQKVPGKYRRMRGVGGIGGVECRGCLGILDRDGAGLWDRETSNPRTICAL